LETYSENLMLTAQLAQAKSTQRCECISLFVTKQANSCSEEYWKLYDQYAEVRQKLADAEDVIDTTKRQMDDVKAERKQPSLSLFWIY